MKITLATNLILDILLAFFLAMLIGCQGENTLHIRSLIEDYQEEKNSPAIAVAVIKSGELIHISADGSRDIEKNLPAKLSAPFSIASVSKPVTSLAIFSLVEKGEIDLSEDINNYLPFTVNNPHHPTDRITVQQLLNHRSGIIDDLDVYLPFWSKPKGDNPLSLSMFLSKYLIKGGNYYSEKNFRQGKDFKDYEYSNTGYSLLGLIVEHVSGMSFSGYTKKNIFSPLNMKNTGWFLKDFDETKIAKTYVKDKGFKFYGYNGYPDYPAGQLRTSIRDYAKLIVGYLNADSQKFILRFETVTMITPISRKPDDIFYTWFTETVNEREYYQHNGSDIGTTSLVNIDVANKNGLIIFANSEINLEDLKDQILREIL